MLAVCGDSFGIQSFLLCGQLEPRRGKAERAVIVDKDVDTGMMKGETVFTLFS